MIQRKNIWPFGDSTKTTTVYRGRGVSSKSSGIRSALKYKGLSRTASGVKYKGYHVWDDENGWHTSLDPGSWFDSKKDVTRLIDSWEKDRKNPLPLSAGSMILGPSEKWLKKHGVMRRGNPRKPIVIGGWEYWTVGGEVYRNAVGNRGYMESGKPSNARWESSVDHFQHFRPMLESEAKKLNPQNVTDRALRYRAQKAIPQGEKRCNLCGLPRSVEVGHVNGNESDTEPNNLFWTCRPCNVLAGNAMRRAGVGRLTHQYNPEGGAKSVGQWLTAVTSMKGENGAMSVSDAVAMIRATSPAKRSEYASEIWRRRKGRGNPVKYTTKAFDALTAKAQQAQQEYSREFGKTGVLKGRALSLYKKWVGLVRKADEMREAGIDEYLDSARRNPETESADSFQKFHGFNAKEQITVEKDVHYHSNLWAVGKLEKLEVISPDGEQVMLNGFKGAILSANEDNSQLYIEGGDQGVDLSEFGIGKPYHDKEDLGEVKKLFYFTNKTHLGDQGGEAIYHHTLGEERTKRNYLFGKLKGRKVPRPRLVYDVMNQALEIIGGEYVIEPEGIRN